MSSPENSLDVCRRYTRLTFDGVRIVDDDGVCAVCGRERDEHGPGERVLSQKDALGLREALMAVGAAEKIALADAGA